MVNAVYRLRMQDRTLRDTPLIRSLPERISHCDSYDDVSGSQRENEILPDPYQKDATVDRTEHQQSVMRQNR